MPPKIRVFLQYYVRTGRKLNLENPMTFSEKCQAVKFSTVDLSPFVDKIQVKEFVKRRIPPEHIIPTLYHGATLPPIAERTWSIPFVLKTNNASGGNIFVKETPNWPAIEHKLARLLSIDYSKESSEMFYAAISPQVLIEPMISGRIAPTDFKFFMFDGKLEFVQVDTDRHTEHRRAFYDGQWNKLPIQLGYADEKREVAKPLRLEQMIHVAERVAAGFPFVRVDLYEVNGKVFFGEMTFAPESGLKLFEPQELDLQLGAKWPLSTSITSP